MATKDTHPRDDEQRPAGRKDRGSGNASVGAVDGIGGAGGSSGAGSVRAKAGSPGDISGIDAVGKADIPATQKLIQEIQLTGAEEDMKANNWTC